MTSKGKGTTGSSVSAGAFLQDPEEAAIVQDNTLQSGPILIRGVGVEPGVGAVSA